ncbi:Transposase [Dolosicoccus paucivorans]|nr:Transposase [Dolosicoccus paucivorans]
MRSNSKHTVEDLERYIEMYLSNGKSYKELRDDYGLILSESVFGQKVLRYQAYGLKGIQSRLKNSHYTKDFKMTVVNEHIIEGIPIKQLARKYNIPAHSTVRNWIMKYTKGEEIRSYTPKPEVYTMKGKKKSREEKIEIVKDCLANGLSYKDTAEKYQVSYNNVYSWVQKYKKHGPDGLVDGRGRGKPSTIQTAEEKVRAEMAALKARNEYLETENAALKKLDEVERELMSRKQGMKGNTKRSRNYKKKDSK